MAKRVVRKAPRSSRNTGTWKWTRHSRGPGSVRQAVEGVLEIEESGEAPVLQLERLREVDRLRVAREHLDRFLGYLRNVDGSGLLELEDRDTGVNELLERDGNVLVLERLVADVEDDAEVAS